MLGGALGGAWAAMPLPRTRRTRAENSGPRRTGRTGSADEEGQGARSLQAEQGLGLLWDRKGVRCPGQGGTFTKGDRKSELPGPSSATVLCGLRQVTQPLCAWFPACKVGPASRCCGVHPDVCVTQKGGCTSKLLSQQRPPPGEATGSTERTWAAPQKAPPARGARRGPRSFPSRGGS